MSCTLHAFSSYKVEEVDGSLEIIYENDEDYDIAYGNWHYINKVIKYGNILLGKNIILHCYDSIDEAERVKEKGMELVEPLKFAKKCEAVIENVKKLSGTENPLLGGNNEHLYDSYEDASFEEQKENLLYYAEKLLNWANRGLVFPQ